MKKKLLILGAGGHGKVVADIAIKMNLWDEISFLDDNNKNLVLKRLNVIGKISDVTSYVEDHDVVIAVGNNETRKQLYNMLVALEASMPTLIHPNAVIGENVLIGEATVIMAGAVINCDTMIGKACIINTSASVDHDNKIGDFVHVSPGVNLAGNVILGDSVWVGIGACISNNVKVTNQSVIGAGAVVVKDIVTTGIYVGVPAKKI